MVVSSLGILYFKKFCYYNEDIQQAFMNDEPLEVFEKCQMCKYFWSMF